jgi:hypothetical protein
VRTLLLLVVRQKKKLHKGKLQATSSAALE